MKYDCPYCHQSLEKAAEEWAKWKWAGPGERPKDKCPSCGGAVAHRIYLEEIASFLTLGATILIAFRWLHGKSPIGILWAILGVVVAIVPLTAWVNNRLRNAQRYKRANAI